MTAGNTSQEIDTIAARWVARIDARPLSPDEEGDLNAWLESDVRHFGAYAKACAVAAQTERIQVLNGGGFFDRPEPPEVVMPNRRKVMWAGGMMAACAAVAAVGVAFQADGRTFSTGVGETRVVPLEDGSVITLNTNSKVVVNYARKIRKVNLLKGEALFDVAKDRTRPFVVNAGGTQVRAVGTSFSVQYLPQKPVTVLVTEGVVEVKRPDVSAGQPVRIAANSRAVAVQSAPIATEQVTAAEVTRQTAWRVGRLAFEGETLSRASEMFARYSDVHIVITDPTIANETITGLFVSNDPVGFAEAVATSLNLRVEVGNGEIRLYR